MASTLQFHQTTEGCRLLGVERHAISVEKGEVGVQMLRTRALAGVRLARVPRFGRGLTSEQVVEAIEGLRTPASESRVPQINVEVYVEDPDRHHAVEAALEEGGFKRAETTHSYVHTLWMDLGPSEDDLLMSLHRSARRNIRIRSRLLQFSGLHYHPYPLVPFPHLSTVRDSAGAALGPNPQPHDPQPMPHAVPARLSPHLGR